MKILILANKDIASNFALNLLIPKLTAEHQLHLWLSAKVGNSTNQPKPLSRLKFFEQDLLNKILNPLLVNNSSNKFVGFDGFKPHLASELIEENNINSADTIARLSALAPDLIISIRYGGILKDQCINIPTRGVINLHSGVLPKYRGVMATFWAMLNGETSIGTTLHTIDDGTIDTGNIIKISTMAVQKDRSYLDNVLALYRQGTADIIDAVSRFAKNQEIITSPQSNSDAYFTFPTTDDLIRFEQKGLKLVDEQEYIAFLNEHYIAAQ